MKDVLKTSGQEICLRALYKILCLGPVPVFFCVCVCVLLLLFLKGIEASKCKENINQQVYQAVAKLGQRTAFLNQTKNFSFLSLLLTSFMLLTHQRMFKVKRGTKS